MRHVHRRHGRATGSGRRVVVAGLLAAFALLGIAPTPASAAGAAKTDAAFTAFVTAWNARSTTAVVGCLEPEGKVVFRLFAYPFSGKVRVMGTEQAKEALKTYFKRITSVRLKDVTPEKSPKNVRLYEYAYKASRENARTTHLQVKLKQDENGLWVLDSVTESAKPRR